MANPVDDNIKVVSVTDAGQSLDWGQWMGAIALLNLGANDVWVKFDGSPAAADGDGQMRLVVGLPFSQPRAKFKTIGFIAAAAQTATVQALATEAYQD